MEQTLHSFYHKMIWKSVNPRIFCSSADTNYISYNICKHTNRCFSAYQHRINRYLNRLIKCSILILYEQFFWSEKHIFTQPSSVSSTVTDTPLLSTSVIFSPVFWPVRLPQVPKFSVKILSHLYKNFLIISEYFLKHSLCKTKMYDRWVPLWNVMTTNLASGNLRCISDFVSSHCSKLLLPFEQ